MIAAMGHQHLHVEKQVLKDEDGFERASVSVDLLEQDENRRLTVLARLVSGMETNDTAVQTFIQRLRQQANEFHRQYSHSALARS
jgi:DNA repair ATPase RecN